MLALLRPLLSRRTPSLARPLVATLALCLGSCTTSVPVGNELPPEGAMTGTVVYSGPLPCTEAGHVVGGAVLLFFKTQLLPPPEGLGTTAASFVAVPGDVLFQSIQSQIPSHADGSLACPPEGGPTVTVSADWVNGPLVAGDYEIRGFYDYSGQFSPVLSIHNLPVDGDIAGGALVNATAAAQGAAPQFEQIVVGEPDGQGGYTIPPQGARVDNITVTLGKVLPWGRPIFNVTPAMGATSSAPPALTMTQDYLLAGNPKTNPTKAGTFFYSIPLSAGVAANEITAAEDNLYLQAGPPYNQFVLYPHTDANGKIIPILETITAPFTTTDVHGMTVNVPADTLQVPQLFPEAIFSMLSPSDTNMLTPTSSPAVIISGLVANQSLVATAGLRSQILKDSLVVYVRPSVVCLNPLDPNTDIYLVTTSLTSMDGSQLVYPDDLKRKLAAQFAQYTNGDVSRTHVVEGCLPTGNYAINLVYDTGQAWTVPNEAGECVGPLETSAGLGPMGLPQCMQADQKPRPSLPSQTALLQIVPDPNDGGAYCSQIQSSNRGDTTYTDHTTGTTKPILFTNGVPTVCLPAP